MYIIDTDAHFLTKAKFLSRESRQINRVMFLLYLQKGGENPYINATCYNAIYLSKLDIKGSGMYRTYMRIRVSA